MDNNFASDIANQSCSQFTGLFCFISFILTNLLLFTMKRKHIEIVRLLYSAFGGRSPNDATSGSRIERYPEIEDMLLIGKGFEKDDYYNGLNNCIIPEENIPVSDEISTIPCYNIDNELRHKTTCMKSQKYLQLKIKKTHSYKTPRKKRRYDFVAPCKPCVIEK